MLSVPALQSNDLPVWSAGWNHVTEPSKTTNLCDIINQFYAVATLLNVYIKYSLVRDQGLGWNEGSSNNHVVALLQQISPDWQERNGKQVSPSSSSLTFCWLCCWLTSSHDFLQLLHSLEGFCHFSINMLFWDRNNSEVFCFFLTASSIR